MMVMPNMVQDNVSPTRDTPRVLSSAGGPASVAMKRGTGSTAIALLGFYTSKTKRFAFCLKSDRAASDNE
jgi:hypothetical protein